MPYRDKKCGIYCITSPNGSQYVGSSCNIKNRWSEHRMGLKRGNHHSARLQAAWKKHGLFLAFSILEECPREQLNVKEQEWIDRFNPELNTTTFVANVWVNESTRKKLEAIHRSEEWSEARRKIALSCTHLWKAVDCSNGVIYPSLTEAARAFGVKASGIAHLVKTQRVGHLGVKFKLVGDDWRDVTTSGQARVQTRNGNGGFAVSAESRLKMSIAKTGRKPSEKAVSRAVEVTSLPVVAMSIETGEVVVFPSQRDAARSIRPDNYRTAGSQINKACSGVKRSAYGYIWSRGLKHAA